MFKTIYRHEFYQLSRQSPILFFIYPALLFLSAAIYLILLGYPLTPLSSPLSFFHLVSLIQFFILPYIAILGFGAERQLRTDWTLLSWPTTTSKIVYAKFLAWSHVLFVPAFICGFWLVAGSTWYVYDWGLIFCGFLQVVLTGLLTLSLSLYCSIKTRRTWHGIFMAQGLLLLWVFGDFVIQKISIYEYAEWFLSAFTYARHDRLLQRGLLSTSTLTFFIGLIVFFLQKAWKHLELLRGQTYSKSRIIIPALWVLTLLYPVHIDMSMAGLNRLDPFTKKLLTQAQDPLYIHYYRSEKFSQKMAVLSVERQLKLYEEASSWVVVRFHQPEEDAAIARELGFLKEKDGYAGVLIEYQDRAAVIPLLIDSDEVEYLVTSKLHELFFSRPQLAFRSGQYQPTSDYSLLIETLNRHFYVQEWIAETPLPDAQGALILSANSLSEAEMQEVLRAHKSGVGVFFGYTGVGVPTQPHMVPLRYEPSDGLKILAQEGIISSNNLIADPEGFMFSGESSEGRPVHKIYPFWPKGFLGKDVTWRLLLPIFSTAIWPDVNWTPLLFSSVMGGIQEGSINLDPNHLNTKPLPHASGPYILVAEKDGAVPFIVAGSETIFSNMSPVLQNFVVAELLGWKLSGLSEISRLKSKKLNHLLMRRPYSPILDTVRFLIQVTVFVLLSGLFLTLMIVRRIWFTKTPFL
ncbi:MAG: hypothetical protein ACRCVN_04910 [Spirochaetia bacterium]